MLGPVLEPAIAPPIALVSEKGAAGVEQFLVPERAQSGPGLGLGVPLLDLFVAGLVQVDVLVAPTLDTVDQADQRAGAD